MTLHKTQLQWIFTSSAPLCSLRRVVRRNELWDCVFSSPFITDSFTVSMIKEEMKEALRTETADVDTLVAIGLKDQTKHSIYLQLVEKRL